ncbi:hypothetical protein [Tuwongella immobilis]|uniref:Uncharacterized protein n=1 Tax=Tuwongella immobilis TaxID=692036 RepID=A0A6C2YSE1_9BACT|nr:hypothetical protein [Tuwongella immobilis]VIP04053.1 Uncharacterized protein OS=Blastopirellula marina DSM 3645 GN=DSM3645_12451 PE=4 SV=1 [Tuwongella immobilis]VTS05473.1 Uncharacterized protein OS=Blastopirellula marina DSM 3645 GN=DSM3645_12451 PE=4 SV=1 [Tuwongella immobilis]
MIAGRRFQAPKANRAILAEPAPATWAEAARQNRQGLLDDLQIGGMSLRQLRADAAREAIAAAQAYHREAGEPVPSLHGRDPCRIIAAGHQPELFHPGVWAKNFALAGFAAAQQAVALNLIVDHDTLKSASMHLPVWSGESPPQSPEDVQLASLAYDSYAGETPYEERRVQDEALFASFPERLAERTRNWGYLPLAEEFWRTMTARATMTDLLGERIVRARRSFERQWGCVNLELPMSRLATLPSFARFVGHILTDLPLFRDRYNSAVHDYRRLHGIRSRNHPVPDLEVSGDRVEAPFWIWRHGDPRRGRMFVSTSAAGLQLFNGDQLLATLPPQIDDHWIDRWQTMIATGIRIRTKALTTTLYARLILSEFFIHGIGGGKYDEVTDVLISQAFALPVPQFAVLSATLHLPLPGFASHAREVRHAHQYQRDLFWNPQRHLSADTALSDSESAAIAQKAALVRDAPTGRAERRQWFQTLQTLTETIRPAVEQPLKHSAEQLEIAKSEAAANGRLERRDFPLALYPESTLRPFMQSLAAQSVLSARQ